MFQEYDDKSLVYEILYFPDQFSSDYLSSALSNLGKKGYFPMQKLDLLPQKNDHMRPILYTFVNFSCS